MPRLIFVGIQHCNFLLNAHELFLTFGLTAETYSMTGLKANLKDGYSAMA